jgi:hypothetical protein
MDLGSHEMNPASTSCSTSSLMNPQCSKSQSYQSSEHSEL